MTITQAVVITLLIAMWASGTGVELTNNTTLLIILLISLIALSGVSTIISNNNSQGNCRNRLLNQSGTITQTLF